MQLILKNIDLKTNKFLGKDQWKKQDMETGL
jgi:hypothetical protein